MLALWGSKQGVVVAIQMGLRPQGKEWHGQIPFFQQSKWQHCEGNQRAGEECVRMKLARFKPLHDRAEEIALVLALSIREIAGEHLIAVDPHKMRACQRPNVS